MINGVPHEIVHYIVVPQSAKGEVKEKGKGWNNVHGFDEGGLPPGWEDPALGAARRGFNNVYGFDDGPVPPGWAEGKFEMTAGNGTGTGTGIDDVIDADDGGGAGSCGIARDSSGQDIAGSDDPEDGDGGVGLIDTLGDTTTGDGAQDGQDHDTTNNTGDLDLRQADIEPALIDSTILIANDTNHAAIEPSPASSSSDDER